VRYIYEQKHHVENLTALAKMGAGRSVILHLRSYFFHVCTLHEHFKSQALESSLNPSSRNRLVEFAQIFFLNFVRPKNKNKKDLRRKFRSRYTIPPIIIYITAISLRTSSPQQRVHTQKKNRIPHSIVFFGRPKKFTNNKRHTTYFFFLFLTRTRIINETIRI
jgi:hypothetical protein